ncbi:MAG: DUF2089 family protein [Candidatus Delongbacteria bacterium]
MKKQLNECPVCASELMVSEYTCKNCRTKISGSFSCEAIADYADKEIMDFIRIFIFAEGNIKQVEKVMNCSYPKVKNLLKKAKTALHVEQELSADSPAVLDKLARGEITTEEALQELNKGRLS